ncbi:MAG: dephospho-CoA kinase [Muribaculaceae bacterium]|nr:dephospho-CoA kinase [Muribaculaceae bacterium]
MKRLIAITGGIGSGKSVVSRILEAMGYPVYDCDSRAKQLMDSSERIKSAIAADISVDVILPDKTIDRAALARIVFADADALAALNGIVHAEVRADIGRWMVSLQHELAFVETAILYQSGIDHMVDEVWDVTAPVEVRIERVMKRNAMDREDVINRINSQHFVPVIQHGCVHIIDNTPDVAILPQIEALLNPKY